MDFDNIEAAFEFDPSTNYLVTPPPPPVQDVMQQQYKILILGPIPT